MKKKPLFAPSRVQTGRGSAPAGIPLGGRLRGLLALGLCLCLALGPLPAPALAAGAPTTKWEDNADIAWYSGHESDTEFTLTTAAQLAGLAAKVNAGTDFANKTIRLGANIDLAAHLWKPIGSSLYGETAFNGTLDGGGKTIRGMTISSDGLYQGLFGAVGTNGTVHSLYIAGAAVSKAAHDKGGTCMGILAGENEGAIYDCAVSGSVEYSDDAVSGSSSYIGGLAGRNSGTVKNCGAQLTRLTGNFGLTNDSGGLNVGGIAAEGAVENCFADVDAANVTVTGSGATDKHYRLAPTASYSYWDGTTALTDSSAPNAPSYTQCYEVSAEQIAGTGSSVIGSGSTHAQTPSLVMALNNWTAAQSGGSAYSDWALKNGAPLPKLFVPDYIDIGVIPEQSKESVTGDVNADVELRGQVWENAELLSVTLPATIPFILDVDGTGALKRVLSATATLTNRSDMGVKVTLTEVADTDSLLGKVSLSLIPDPLPAGGSVALSAGGGKTDELASLAAQAAGVPTTCTLKVDGAAKAGVPSVGGDGDTFTVGLTLKVSKS